MSGDVIESALAAAAAWIAEAIGYPVETKMPDHPMPQALWDALVDHVHADETGKWHGNELDREETESWLADEAGRPSTSPDDYQPCIAPPGNLCTDTGCWDADRCVVSSPAKQVTP